MAGAAGGGVNKLWTWFVNFTASDVALRHYELLVALFFTTLLIDRIARKPTARYRSRSTWNDFAYFAFYYFGPFQLMMIPIFGPMQRFIHRFVPWMQMNLIGSLPLHVKLVVFIIASDFLGYWLHRWIHAVPALWAFHKVHHSQEQMTVLTNYRRHPVDELAMRLGSFLVFQIIGTTVMTWAILDFVGNTILLLQHSGLSWTYGKAERVLISPRMHGLHHSLDEQHFNRNFGMMFSIWDRLFGTSVAEGTVRATGVEPRMPESLWRQLVDPFREVFQRKPRAIDTAVAIEPGSAA